MVIIGIDPASTRLALVALGPDGDYVAQKVKGLAGKATAPWSPEACGEAATISGRFVEVVERKWPEVDQKAWIEAPLVGRGGVRSTMVQAFTSGACQAALINHGVPVELVYVSQWKAAICGHGAATKDDVAEALRQRWPTFVQAAGGDLDLHDAAAIALYGRHLGQRPE